MKQINTWSGWSLTRSLERLGVSRTAYYRRRRVSAAACAAPVRPCCPHAVLAEEKAAVLRYALDHPNPRHRELAWKMVDDNVAYLSPSTVYRILREKGLVPSWPFKRKKRYREADEKARRPDTRWQSDIRYLRIGGRRYYMVVFIDEYSRYVTHHELMCYLDGATLSLEAQRAIETLPDGPGPIIQTDNGSGYISQEFKKVLTERGLGHVRITPHCPEENGLVERAHRTLGETLDALELENLEQARKVVAEVVQWYNEKRLHSALQFLRPIDYYRGDPEELLNTRRVKLAEARHRRKQKNLGIRQQTIAFKAHEREERRSLINQPICAAC